MTTKEMSEYVENEGTERLYVRAAVVPTDNPELAALFKEAQRALGAYADADAAFFNALKSWREDRR